MHANSRFVVILTLIVAFSSPSAPAQEVVWFDATSGPLGDAGDAESAAWGDFDNDGDPDLYVTTWAFNKLLRNDGDQGFVQVAAGPLDQSGYAKSVNWIDFDNDGWLDLCLVNYTQSNKLFRNLGDGLGFEDVTPQLLTVPSHAACSAWADYDQDGWLDLYITSFVNGITQPCKLFRNELGVFTDATTPVLSGNNWAQGADWADYDNDGDLDLFVARAGTANYLYRNDGGTFAEVAASPITAPASMSLDGSWGDYDNDGDLDLYLTSWGPNFLFRNEGAGSFVDVTAPPLNAPGDNTSASWVDYDQDGDLDLYLAALGPNQLLRNDGGDVFTDVTGPPIDHPDGTWGAALADYDLDGDVDIYLANGVSGLKALLPGFQTDEGGRDGTENALYRNDCENGNHWLNLLLVGEASNRSAIGARVWCHTGALVQMREVSGNTGYWCFDSLDVEFGLGAATAVDSVVVRWPSGVTSTYRDLQVDQRHVIAETIVTGVTDGAGDAGDQGNTPEAWSFQGCYPNPFNPRATLRFNLRGECAVILRIFALSGREIWTSGGGLTLSAGTHSLTWNGCDDLGRVQPSGVYFYRLEACGTDRTGKMTLIR